MFGKGARQIQADPTLDLTKCKCCQCDKVECKGCIEGHKITDTAGCCPSRNEGLIFEYERPGWPAQQGPECCPGNYVCCDPNTPDSCCSSCFDEQGRRTCPYCVGSPAQSQFDLNADYSCFFGGPCPCRQLTPTSRCCSSGKRERSNVRFYYNYIGKYFKINYEATGKYAGPRRNITPRNCSYCDPTSHNDTLSGDEGGNIDFDRANSCLDYRNSSQPGGIENDTLCTARAGDIPWESCQCMGNGQRRDTLRGPDPGTRGKRLSNYRKRQMEKDPYYMWLLDIMCYDEGNIQFNPAQRFFAEIGADEATIQENFNGTLYEHLVGVVHCEHWYEQASCDQNPQHDDPNGIVGGWIMDPFNEGVPLGYNTSKLAPRFWIYACSGVPLFDFEIQDAVERGFITEDERRQIHLAFGKQLTPSQGLMKKLAAGGYLDVGDWRQEALSEIRQLRGNTFTAAAYGGIINGDPNFGACCLGNTCMGGVSAEYCQFTGGNFFPASTCNDSFCSSHFCSDLKYLGPVRKRWAVAPSLILPVPPQFPDLILDPNISNPLRARPNIISPAPDIAKGETFADGLVLESLQLPNSLIQDPWNGSYPLPPLPGQPKSEEFKAFELWKDSQWVYMHARPGGWSYVCPGYGFGAEGEELDLLREVKIPDLPRGRGNGNFLGCLEGLQGIPQDNTPIQPCELPEGFCQTCEEVETGTDPDGLPIYETVCRQNPRIECLEAGGPSCVGLACSASDLCSDHFEMGGGGTPCENLALKANCDGIRFLYFVQRFTVTEGFQGYYECARTINSYLYKVNVTTGNYNQFCPHVCRTLQIPKQIANAVPTLFSSSLAHREICDRIQNGLLEGSGTPNTNRMCPSSYCFASARCNSSSEGRWYGPEGCRCCEQRINAGSHSPIPPQAYTHPASNRQACPAYPGPGYPTIYDGEFLGTPIQSNPRGCCWKCGLSGTTPVPDSYQGVEDYFECWNLQPQEIKDLDNNAVSGRGFIYLESIDSATSDCPQIWAGECACGTNSPNNVPPASSGEFCNPPGTSSGGGGPPPPPGGG